MRAKLIICASTICALVAMASAQTPGVRAPLRDALRVRPGELAVNEEPVPVIILGNPHWWERLEAARTAPRRGPFVSPSTPDGDADGDGFQSVSSGGNDCNDRDMQAYPGNVERADTVGHDEDCDPTTIAALGRHQNDGDADADGFVSYTVFNFAMAPDGYVYAIVRGSDCNDSVRSINPNASELAADHVDNNCNGAIDEPLPAEATTDYVPSVEGSERPSDARRR